MPRRARSLLTIVVLLLALPAAASAAAPAPLYEPQITGEPVDGEPLNEWDGLWDEGGETTTYARRWLLCDAAGDDCAPIDDADGVHYFVAPEDVGSTLLIEVTATNASGSTTALAARAFGPIQQADAPESQTAPYVWQAPEAGQSILGGLGAWGQRTGALSYDLQWRRCDATGGSCADVAGATGILYGVTTADMGATLRLRVTATNAHGSDSASSAATAVVPSFDAPVSLAAPVVTGQRGQGHEVTASGADWGANVGSPAFSYEWLRCDAAGDDCVTAAAGGFTLESYTVTEDDVGATLRVRVTATNAAGSATATSAAVAIPAYEPILLPEIAGTAVMGEHVSVSSPGAWDGEDLDYAYAWRRCDTSGDDCAEIDGATGPGYDLTADDVGARVRAVVTATGARGSSLPVESDPTWIVAFPSGPALTAAPSIAGDATVGSSLSVSGGDWGPDTGPLTFEYSWMRCTDAEGIECDLIDGADASSYTLVSDDAGSTMAVQVTATNPAGSQAAWLGPTDFVTQP